jgi:hypothetical protein
MSRNWVETTFVQPWLHALRSFRHQPPKLLRLQGIGLQFPARHVALPMLM